MNPISALYELELKNCKEYYSTTIQLKLSRSKVEFFLLKR